MLFKSPPLFGRYGGSAGRKGEIGESQGQTKYVTTSVQLVLQLCREREKGREKKKVKSTPDH